MNKEDEIKVNHLHLGKFNMETLYRNSKILIVDDDEDDFIITSTIIQAIPGNCYQIDWASTYKEGIKQLTANKYDLYFVDYSLGAKSGVDFLQEANVMQCESPIVLLTGQGNYKVDLQAMQLGAVDYLIKADLNTEKTERCIRYALERAQTLKALKHSEAKYRHIFEKSKDILFVADKSLRITDVNDAIYTLLGATVAETIGKLLVDLITDSDQQAAITKAFNGDLPVKDLPVTLTSVNGSKLNCIINLGVERNTTDSIYVQGIIHDITSLKRAEKAALQSEKLAATGRLVRTLAHEVRNPLNNITMSADQLMTEAIDEDSQLYLDIIKRNSLRINNLISELLHSSNPKDNTHRLHPLQEIIKEVIAAAADRLTLKRIESEVAYPELPVIILADNKNLKLALLNIVINAIEAMSEQTGKLTIALQYENEAAMLIIEDNGCGISEENINKIFEPYYTRKQNGAGLGLAFTLNILRTHNAVIDVSSTLGKGTVFTITFPKADEEMMQL